MIGETTQQKIRGMSKEWKIGTQSKGRGTGNMSSLPTAKTADYHRVLLWTRNTHKELRTNHAVNAAIRH